MTTESTTPAAVLAGVRALGVVHLAVGLTVACPDKVTVPLAVLVAAGGAVLSVLHLPDLPARAQVGWGYGLPLVTCITLHLLVGSPVGWSESQRVVATFVWRTWTETPLSVYLLVAAYALTRPPDEPPESPFSPPR